MTNWLGKTVLELVCAIERKAGDAEQAAQDALEAHGEGDEVDRHDIERYRLEELACEVRQAAEEMGAA